MRTSGPNITEALRKLPSGFNWPRLSESLNWLQGQGRLDTRSIAEAYWDIAYYEADSRYLSESPYEGTLLGILFTLITTLFSISLMHFCISVVIGASVSTLSGIVPILVLSLTGVWASLRVYRFWDRRIEKALIAITALSYCTTFPLVVYHHGLLPPIITVVILVLLVALVKVLTLYGSDIKFRHRRVHWQVLMAISPSMDNMFENRREREEARNLLKLWFDSSL